MNSKFQINPIFKKEIKLGARTVKFPLAVALYSLVMVAISFGNLILQSGMTYYNVRTIDYNSLTEAFIWLAFAQISIICIAIPIITAGTIAGERERQTLDIMLTAPISRWGIVWGKLIGCLAQIFMFLISSLPALAICFLYGGIQWTSLAIFIACSMIVAFFAGAVGVWCSSVFKRTIMAVIMTMLITVCFYFLPVIIYAVVFGAKEAIFYATYNGTGSTAGMINMANWALVLLLSPAVGYYDSIQSSSGMGIMDYIQRSVIKNSRIVEIVIPRWSVVTMVVTLLLGVLFLYFAARQLDAPRRKGKKLSEPANQEIHK